MYYLARADNFLFIGSFYVLGAFVISESVCLWYLLPKEKLIGCYLSIGLHRHHEGGRSGSSRYRERLGGCLSTFSHDFAHDGVLVFTVGKDADGGDAFGRDEAKSPDGSLMAQ